MQYLSFAWLGLWAGVAAYAQDLNAVTSTAVGADPLMSLIAGGGVTFPTALIVSALILAKWTPTLRVRVYHENAPGSGKDEK